MRTSTRIILAGLISVLSLAAVPAQSASAAQMKPSFYGCCR